MAIDLVPIPRVPAALHEAALIGRLIPFIGAGASRLAGCPGWAEFADGALRQLVDKGKFTYSQFDQIKHLSPRSSCPLRRLLPKIRRLRSTLRQYCIRSRARNT